MKRKIAACFLAGVLGMTGIPVPAAATQTVSSKNTVSSVKAADPLTAIQEQASAMDAQEQLEEEEEMPAQDPDPLVLDNGNVVPASQASWVKEEGDETAAVFDARNDFSDGASEEEEVVEEPVLSAAPESEAAETDMEAAGAESAVSVTPEPETEEKVETADTEENSASEMTDTEADGETADESAGAAEVFSDETEETSVELQMEAGEETEVSAGASSEETEDFYDQEDFSAGEASQGDLGTYQEETLAVEDGQDITAPLNTLFLQLKDKATEETPYKIIIPPGNYQLTGTLCMYSNMYLYAKGAVITKTSATKHLILRLGNTKDSQGGYDGYQNIVIDGGTWDYNYQCVADKDAPGGFVGFCIGHARNVTIKNATFLNNLKSHFLEFGGVKNARITGCTFSGYYKNYVSGGQECIQIDCCTDETNVFPQYRPYDGTTCEDFVVDGNVFSDVFSGVGTHSMMSGETYKRITVTNNTFHNIKKRCIEFMNYEDAVAENNTMVNVGMGVDVISASKNVHQTQGYEGGPDTQKDRDIRIAGNYISLAKTSSIGGVAWVCSGVHIEGYEMKAEGAIPKGMYPVKGVTVEDNEISGYGNGVSISLADTDIVTGNQIKMKKTSAYSNLGIYAKDARGTVITGNTVSGTANAGIYINEAGYAKGSGEKNLVSDNGVSAAGGDGIYLQSVNAASTAEKNTVKSAGGSGIRVRSGGNISILGNTCALNKDHGAKIEYTTGSIRVKNNSFYSNVKSGLMIWKAKASEIAGNRMYKNKGNGVYAYNSVITAMKSNSFNGNGKALALYAKDCKGWSSINRPSAQKVTEKSTAITGKAAGSRTVTAYTVRSGKTARLGGAAVDKNSRFTIKIRKQKKNTVLKLVSKDRYGNAVTVTDKVR